MGSQRGGHYRATNTFTFFSLSPGYRKCGRWRKPMHPEVRQFSFNSSGFLRNLIVGASMEWSGGRGRRQKFYRQKIGDHV